MAATKAADIFNGAGRGGYRMVMWNSPGGEHPVPSGQAYFAATIEGRLTMVFEGEGGTVKLEEFSEVTGARLGGCELAPESGVTSAFAGLVAANPAAQAGQPAAPAALVAPTGWRFTLNADGRTAYLSRPRVAGSF